MTALTQIQSDIQSSKVAQRVEFHVLTPGIHLKDLPLFVLLPGRGGFEGNVLFNKAEYYSRLMAAGLIPNSVLAMPKIPADSMYMNMKGEPGQWEDFLMLDFLPRIRNQFGTRRRALIFGSYMSGWAALRLALRNPMEFKAVAAVAPSIEPVTSWSEVQGKHRFWRKDRQLEAVFGSPIDEQYWADNHPANIAAQNREKIVDSRLQIYIDTGDADQLWTYEGAEFLHQILWRQRIRHEYHLVRGGDHIGPSIPERKDEAICFLGRAFLPWFSENESEKQFMVNAHHRRSQIQGVDHYSQPYDSAPDWN